MNRFREKVALVTGGASGIGRATALLFAREGAAISILDHDRDGGEESVAQIRAGGRLAEFYTTDVTDEEQVRSTIEQTVARFGRIDVLCNAAGGIDYRGDVVSMIEGEWSHTIAVNLTGTFLVSKYVVPVMLRQGGGAIVNIASAAGLSGRIGLAAYCAAKGGVIQLTRAMALDYATHSIRVNCVCPATTETPRVLRWLNRQPDPDLARAQLTAEIPLGRLAHPEEIAHAVLFLASAEASFITAAALPVDGGKQAR